jgi:AcrR family transcriptional regulator
MGVQERRARQKRELRQEILDAARELFIREGFDNVSMRKIAEKIEYSPTTIYLYFQDKADLLDCLCQETFSRLLKKQATLGQTVSDPLERLRLGLRGYIEFGLKHPNHYQVTFMMLRPPDEAARLRQAPELGKKAFDFLRLNLAQCVEQDLLVAPDIEAASQVLWAMIHGLVSLLIAHPKFPWADRNHLIDTLLDNAFAGLHAAAPAGARPV